MCGIFEIQGDELDIGFINIKEAHYQPEQEMRALIEELWLEYEPYADADFREGFARDVDGRFWELFLGCTLLHAGHRLLLRSDRSPNGGQPDLCVIDGKQRVWIEAITPTRGEQGVDQVAEILPINEGGGFIPAPLRQTQLRTTSAFWTKSQKLQEYLVEGVIAPEEKRLIAISASRFATTASEDPPLVISSLFPIGQAYVSVDRTTGEIVEEGYHYEPTIERLNGVIPRTAFADGQFSHVSGVLWSRIGLGCLSRIIRPLTMAHNPYADVPIEAGWGPWDKEYIAEQVDSDWVVNDIRNG